MGGLTQIKDNTHPFGQTAEEVIAEAVSEDDYPVCFSFPAGHFDDNRAVFFGVNSRLMVTDEKVVFWNDGIFSLLGVK